MTDTSCDIILSVTDEELAKLPERFREPLKAHLKEGEKYKDIASSLKVPVGTVRSRINRARARVAAMRMNPAVEAALATIKETF